MAILAHAGRALQPHDLWGAWNVGWSSLPLLAALAGVVLAYQRGWRSTTDTAARRSAFAGGMVAIAVALVSPLDPLSTTLVSAHMVQHVLLILVAAPLLAASAPGSAILRGTPRVVRDTSRGVRRAAGLDPSRLRRLRSPVGRWLLFVVTLWVWHAAALYGAAIENELVHVLEHATFLGTALAVWSAILGPARVRVGKGFAMLGVFTLGLQSTFLSVLLTFATEAWYAEWIVPPDGWALDPLADQQLAGVLMWIPAGLLHAGIALWLFVGWLHESERPADAPVAVSGAS